MHRTRVYTTLLRVHCVCIVTFTTISIHILCYYNMCYDETLKRPHTPTHDRMSDEHREFRPSNCDEHVAVGCVQISVHCSRAIRYTIEIQYMCVLCRRVERVCCVWFHCSTRDILNISSARVCIWRSLFTVFGIALYFTSNTYFIHTYHPERPL